MKDMPWDKWLPGVLANSQVQVLAEKGYIKNLKDHIQDIDYSSFDLHLTENVYEMKQGSIKPCGPNYNEFLKNNYFSQKLDASDKRDFLLKKKKTYVIELKEEFDRLSDLKSADLHGQATAKSSIGRVDVLARLIVDGSKEYESFNPEELHSGTGKLYLEVTPITFNVGIRPGISLSQIRLFIGNPVECEVHGKRLCEIVLRNSQNKDDTLSVDLSTLKIRNKDIVAFKAKNVEDRIDLWGKEALKPEMYWDLAELTDNRNQNCFQISKDSFYILRSVEKISLPPQIAVYCKAMDESLGEMRIHYAGFVHPYFGYERKDHSEGTPLIFEVRGHDVVVNLLHKEKLAKLIFYRMSDKPDKNDETNDYDTQTLKLSKFFKEF